MDKKEGSLEDQIMLADILLRLTSLERLLISKGVLTAPEIHSMNKEISSQIAKFILKRANVSGDIEAIVKDIHSDKKNN